MDTDAEVKFLAEERKKKMESLLGGLLKTWRGQFKEELDHKRVEAALRAKLGALQDKCIELAIRDLPPVEIYEALAVVAENTSSVGPSGKGKGPTSK